MKPVLLSLAVLMAACAPAAVVAIAPAASADPVNAAGEGQISVKPGRYSWKQKTEIVGFGSHEDNVECLIPEKATMSLNSLAKNLDKGCAVASATSTPTGYNFKMVCNGKIPGTADANVVHTDTTMTITAKGSATVAGVIPAGFSMRADATRVGDCSDVELVQARERYERRKAQGKEF